jgi:hypothetical protein
MTLTNTSSLIVSIEQKQKLLAQHRRNFNYLREQASHYGLEVPLAVHNALTAEKETISELERELAPFGVAPPPPATWQAAVIDADDHWREIIAKNINHLGGSVVQQSTILDDDSPAALENCAMAIVGVPPQQASAPQASAQFTTQMIMKLGRHLPLILLVDWQSRDTVIVLRHAAREYNIETTPVTIFKENFDRAWFSKVVQQVLSR